MSWKFKDSIKSEIPWKLVEIELPLKQPLQPYVSFENLGTTTPIPLDKIGFTYDPRLIPPEFRNAAIPPPPEISIQRTPPRAAAPVVSTEQPPPLPDLSLIKIPRDPRRRKKLFSPKHLGEITKPLSIEIPLNNLPLFPSLFSFEEDLEIKFPLLPGLLREVSSKEENSTYTSPSAVGSLESPLEEGEIRDSPAIGSRRISDTSDISEEYQELFDIKSESPPCPDQLSETKIVRFNRDLSPPRTNWTTDQVACESFEIPFNVQGATVGKIDPPLAVFGRPLPTARPEQCVTLSKKLKQPSPAGRKGSSLILSPVDPLALPERNTRSATPPFKHKYCVQNQEFRHIKINPEIDVPIPKRFKTSKVEIIPSKFCNWICKCKVRGLCSLCYSGVISLNLEVLIKVGEGELPPGAS